MFYGTIERAMIFKYPAAFKMIGWGVWYIIYIYANITSFFIRYYENCEYAT